MSTTHRLRLLLIPLLALLALAGAGGAAAAPPAPASGTFVTTSATFNSARSAGGNTIFDLTATLTYTGTFSGTSVLHGILIFHADGSANFHDVEVFTGTVNGVPGTVTFNLSGTGNNATGTYEGRQVIIGGTGALADLHGVLRQVGTVPTAAQGPVGTYSGQIQFGAP
jgi:hypothetical protein